MSRGWGNVWDDRYRKARAIREEMELKKSLDALVLVDEVRDAAFKHGRTLRDAILAVPDRIGAIVAAENDPVKCRQLIAKELRIVLESVSHDNRK